MTAGEREARDARIRYLSRQGWRLRAIARELGLSKSQVHRVLIASPLSTVVGGPEEEDKDEDPWDDASPEPLGLYDDAEERWSTERFTFVGRERQWFSRGAGNGGYWADMERWVDGEGCSLATATESAEMALHRYRTTHIENELGDYERAKALAEDWQRQRDEYDARAAVTRAEGVFRDRPVARRCARCVHAVARKLQKWTLSCSNSGARYWD